MAKGSVADEEKPTYSLLPPFFSATARYCMGGLFVGVM